MTSHRFQGMSSQMCRYYALSLRSRTCHPSWRRMGTGAWWSIQWRHRESTMCLVRFRSLRLGSTRPGRRLARARKVYLRWRDGGSCETANQKMCQYSSNVTYKVGSNADKDSGFMCPKSPPTHTWILPCIPSMEDLDTRSVEKLGKSVSRVNKLY